MSVPWIRSSLQIGAEGAIQELETKLRSQVPPTHVAIERTSKYSADNPWNAIGSKGGSFDIGNCYADLEKGTGSTAPQPRPTLDRQTSRRHLVNNVMTIKNTFFGVIYIHSKQFVVESGRRSSLSACERLPTDEFKTSFQFYPARWLISWNLNIGVELLIAHGSRGWKNDIRTFRAVSDDHTIFDFCRTGNITGVKALLSSGTASPWDTNTHGWTPLHVCW